MSSSCFGQHNRHKRAVLLLFWEEKLTCVDRASSTHHLHLFVPLFRRSNTMKLRLYEVCVR